MILIHEKGKAVIILLNKWDLAPKQIRESKEVEELTIERLKALNFAPVIKVSALTGKNINKIFTNVEKIYKNYCRKW